ncbi:MAG: heavy-metal-associated domain-containing protein [Microlunatus sp.]|nr:heavy-metal-associated domain-containing protein [Microlunatus sp.]MDN5769743.1 heavy-metal-associated domain-containing protein [Microlunatus sp.]MDN5805024.1 heavy-metal-associated domain-containing protein [Microlunatus sp.]
MSVPVRLLAFTAALAAVFVLALVGARTLLPTGQAAPGQNPTDTTHADGDDMAPRHGDEHDSDQPTVAADPVRGLAAAQDGYRLEAVTAPGRTNVDGTLAFRLVGPDGSPVSDYITAHEKDLHLIVVRSDGTQFRHVHPRLDAAGTWSVPWRWLTAGSYRVFADFVPATTGKTLTLTSTVEVAGDLTPVPPSTDRATSTVDGFIVTMAGVPAAGQSSELTFTVTRYGQPVTTLQPYLGAAGHLVALRAGDLAYLHVHPTNDPAGKSGPAVAFMAETPTPGRYLLYLDFQVDGRVHTATFTTTATR